MLKNVDDFNKVIRYLTRFGFKDRSEMEAYLKRNGFGVNYRNFYTDNENNSIMFKVTFDGNQVYMMETIILDGMTFGTMKKLCGYADGFYFG